MDKEQRQWAATRELQIEDEDGLTQLIIRVSGNEAEFTRGQQHPWDNEHGTGNDETWETWAMDLDTLKSFVQAANWCIEKSEAFDKWQQTKQNTKAFNEASMKSLDRFLEK